MKLYYSPGACSLAPHIVIRELDMDVELVKVDMVSKQTEHGEDFKQINPHGYVPALELNMNEVITEGVAIMQYLADQSPEHGLAPLNGTLERTRLQESLNYLTTELHKAFAPLFSDRTVEEKQAAKEKVAKSLDYIDMKLADSDYLMGDTFSLADAYLFVLSNWTTPTGIGLDKWPNIATFSAKVAAREKVKVALMAEGLLN